MTFEPLDFLILAETQDRRTEPGARTAMNRAYYAVFLKARDNLLDRGLMTERGAGQTHGEVVYALRSNRRGEAANLLAELRRKRERADYDTISTIGEPEASEALTLANQVRTLLSRLEPA